MDTKSILRKLPYPVPLPICILHLPYSLVSSLKLIFKHNKNLNKNITSSLFKFHSIGYRSEVVGNCLLDGTTQQRQAKARNEYFSPAYTNSSLIQKSLAPRFERQWVMYRAYWDSVSLFTKHISCTNPAICNNSLQYNVPYIYLLKQDSGSFANRPLPVNVTSVNMNRSQRTLNRHS